MLTENADSKRGTGLTSNRPYHRRPTETENAVRPFPIRQIVEHTARQQYEVNKKEVVEYGQMSYLPRVTSIHINEILVNPITREVRQAHLALVDLDAILVQEKFHKHWTFTRLSQRWCCGHRTCFDEHTLFKSLSFVFTCSVAAVFNYNFSKCQNSIWF